MIRLNHVIITAAISLGLLSRSSAYAGVEGKPLRLGRGLSAGSPGARKTVLPGGVRGLKLRQSISVNEGGVGIKKTLAAAEPIPNMEPAAAHALGDRVEELMTGGDPSYAGAAAEPVDAGIAEGQVPAASAGSGLLERKGPPSAGEISWAKGVIDKLQTEIKKEIVGQDKMILSAIEAMIAKEHLLIEGGVGVGKTQTVLALARAVVTTFSRIQMTPDMMPADILGHVEYVENKESGEKMFIFQPGPLFAVIVLIDEGNRGQPRTKSALLEAMQNKTISVRGETRTLPKNFVVFYTQNPEEMEGTYPLTEAEIDRFARKISVRPSENLEEIMEIARRNSTDDRPQASPVTDIDEIIKAGEIAQRISVAPSLERYIAHLVRASRRPDLYGLDFKDVVRWPLSERTQIRIMQMARLRALREERSAVTEDDIQAVFLDVTSHRLFLHSNKTKGNKPEFYLKQILAAVKWGVDNYQKWEPAVNEQPQKLKSPWWKGRIAVSAAAVAAAILGASGWFFWSSLGAFIKSMLG